MKPRLTPRAPPHHQRARRTVSERSRIRVKPLLEHTGRIRPRRRDRPSPPRPLSHGESYRHLYYTDTAPSKVDSGLTCPNQQLGGRGTRSVYCCFISRGDAVRSDCRWPATTVLTVKHSEASPAYSEAPMPQLTDQRAMPSNSVSIPATRDQWPMQLLGLFKM